MRKISEPQFVLLGIDSNINCGLGLIEEVAGVFL